MITMELLFVGIRINVISIVGVMKLKHLFVYHIILYKNDFINLEILEQKTMGEENTYDINDLNGDGIVIVLTKHGSMTMNGITMTFEQYKTMMFLMRLAYSEYRPKEIIRNFEQIDESGSITIKVGDSSEFQIIFNKNIRPSITDKDGPILLPPNNVSHLRKTVRYLNEAFIAEYEKMMDDLFCKLKLNK